MKSKIKTILLLIFFLHLMFYSNANVSIRAPFKYLNNIQLDLAGHGALYSLNYERVIFNHSYFKTTIQLGFGMFPSFDNPSYFSLYNYTIPILINEIYSFNKHHIEAGIGIAFYYTKPIRSRLNEYEWIELIALRLGYRYQKPDGKWLYRISFSPLIEIENDFNFSPWGSFSIGYCF